MPRRQPLLAAALLLAFTGCAGPVAAPTVATVRKREVVAKAESPLPEVTAAPTLAPGEASPTPSVTATPLLPLASVAPFTGLTGVVRVPAGILSNHGGGVIANNGGSLVSDWGGALIANNGGSIVSNNGGGILSDYGIGLVSNNGGSIIGNNAGGYRLQQAATTGQVLLQSALVRLVDAAGQPVLGADGKPLTGRTDAAGRYSIPATLPGRNLIVVVELPNHAGSLLGISSRDAGATRQADLDLTSTLTTGYVLSQYVSTQVDPIATLEKLPGDVEVTTRLKADAALTAKPQTPASLSAREVTLTVAGLRREDVAFDAQMEVVKRLLVAAGQSNLGAGRPAVEVPLVNLQEIVFGLDGAVYLNAGPARRLWRLRPDGILETAAGSGSGTPDANIEGKAAPEAGLGQLGSTVVDRAGRLILLERGTSTFDARLSRIEPDGRMHELYRSKRDLTAAFEGPQGQVLFLQATTDGQMQLMELVPEAEPKVLQTYTGEDALALGRARTSGRDEAGKLYVTTEVFGLTGYAYQLDPASPTVTLLDVSVIDPVGNRYRYVYDGTAGRAEVTLGKGGTTTVGPWLPSMRFKGGSIAPDGTAWIYWYDAVWRRTGTTFAHVAGAASAPNTSNHPRSATDLPLQEPEAVAATAAGLFLIDRGAQKVFRVKPGGQGELIAGSIAVKPGTESPGQGDGGPAFDAPIRSPLAIEADAAGVVYVAEQNFLSSQIRRIGLDGIISSLGSVPAQINDIALAPNGDLFLVGSMMVQNGGNQVFRISAAGGTPTIVEALRNQAPSVNGGFTVAANGDLLIAKQGRLERWTQAGVMTLLKAGSDVVDMYSNGLATDATGRIYIGHSLPAAVVRYDPTTGVLTKIAGPGAPFFSGVGVDESLDQVTDVAVGPEGDLYIVDQGHQQVKRIAASELP